MDGELNGSDLFQLANQALDYKRDQIPLVYTEAAEEECKHPNEGEQPHTRGWEESCGLRTTGSNCNELDFFTCC